MKIVVIHHFYRNGSESGENAIVESQISALRRNGHEIFLIGRDSREIEGNFLSTICTGISWALNSGFNPIKEIRRINPDLIIIHNLYPGFSSRWIRKLKIPKIYWLHNFRLFCIAATFHYKNSPCLKCAQKTSIVSLIRKCADNSTLKTIPSFLRFKLHPNLPERNDIDKWVVLSPKAREIMNNATLDQGRISIIPNFVSRISPNSAPATNKKWIFVGRLTHGKGIWNLVTKLPRSIELDIYGDGPLKNQLMTLAETMSNIHLKGSVNREKLLELLPNYVGGFIPSLWVEGIPTTFLEYSAAGLPIIGWKMNSTSDFIEEYECGLVLHTFNPELLAEAIHTIEINREEYSRKSIKMWEIEFSEENWINKVNDLFMSVESLD